jgi:hypothetical protein
MHHAAVANQPVISRALIQRGATVDLPAAVGLASPFPRSQPALTPEREDPIGARSRRSCRLNQGGIGDSCLYFFILFAC